MSVITKPDPEPAKRGFRAHVRGSASSSRELLRVAYRDPEHIPERLTLYASQNLAEPSRVWAETARREHPDSTPAELAEALRTQSAKLARIDGAVAGTPFFLALVPGYMSYLWQEARMTLRTAALYGRDPGELHTAAEMLALRGVHPDVRSAEEALTAVNRTPPPVAARRPLRTWIRSGYAMLIFGGFLSAPEQDKPAGSRDRLHLVVGFAVGAAIWATTWILPVTFMIAMAWGCETHARALGRRALALYDGEAATAKEAIAVGDRTSDSGRSRRRLVRSAVLALSVAIPLVFVAYVNHVRQTVGINWLGALGALVALSLVGATAVVGSRR